jgi:cytochrome c peroxidase
MAVVGLSLAAAALAFGGCEKEPAPQVAAPVTPVAQVDAGSNPVDEEDPVVADATQLVREGREVFRFDTFGSEAFWGGQLGLHRAIAGEANGGVGAGVSPRAALETLGLKVDVEKVPAPVATALQAGQLNLDDPANTVALLQADAVIGVKGFFDEAGRLSAVGIQCALCHSTVDDSFAPGIGKRRDGWPNRDLDVGAIIASAPDLTAIAKVLGLTPAEEEVATAETQDAIRGVLRGWGRGRFDAQLLLDGKVEAEPTVLPAAFGLAGVNLHTYNGWGSVTYWNAFVANLEMQGQGTFFDPRLDDASRFPRAAANRFGHKRPPEGQPDLVTPKLASLHFYQLALKPPRPPADSFDAARAQAGQAVFVGKARCAECHVPPLFTEPGWNMHTAEEIGIDDAQAQRSPDEHYRTTPLGGLFTRAKGGFYHDGRFATLQDVVQHYERHFALALSEQERGDLVEYLKSL